MNGYLMSLKFKNCEDHFEFYVVATDADDALFVAKLRMQREYPQMIEEFDFNTLKVIRKV